MATAASGQSVEAVAESSSMGRAATVEENSWAILYYSRDSTASIFVTPELDIQSKWGRFIGRDMIGLRWGSKVASNNGYGFAHILRPTPELWTRALPHRTQILYLPDSSFIISYLGVQPGQKVVEAGTGSGSFTHSLARAVGDEGKVLSFEFNEERYEKALVEFEEHGLKERVTLRHRNVLRDGFLDEGQETAKEPVDAVFLDLPAPWEAISSVTKCMRRDKQTKVCCFSPCIEQVLRTATTLSENGFSDIRTYETLTRAFEPTTLFLPTVGDAIARLKRTEDKKQRRRQGQINEAKRKREEKALKNAQEEAAGAAAKDGKDEDEILEDVAEEIKAKKAEPAANGNGKRARDDDDDDPEPPLEKLTAYKPSTLSRGHTSFLTFATLPALDEL